MPNTCVAFNCKNRQTKGSGISFHRFPTRDEVRKKWIAAVRRANWQPTAASFLCSKHFADSCFRKINDRNYLLENSVPEIFDFPGNARRQTTVAAENPAPAITSDIEPQFRAVIPAYAEHDYSLPRLEELKKQIDESKVIVETLRKRLKLMQQAGRREKEKCAKLKRLLQEAHKREHDRRSQVAVVENRCSEVMRELYNSQDRDGVQYSEGVKNFALTLNSYSVKAYEYVRKHVPLPHPSTLRRWVADEERIQRPEDMACMPDEECDLMSVEIA